MKYLAIALVAACASSPQPAHVNLTTTCPTAAGDYNDVVWSWTARDNLHDGYQEAIRLAAVFKSPEWRVAYAARAAQYRGLAAGALQPQACADAASNYEIEILFTTWDRNENDLDRGKKSVWHVVLVDDQGKEIEPIQIVKDKRPANTLRADYPAYEDFTTAYIARFPKEALILGDNVHAIRLWISGPRGHVEAIWQAAK